MENNVTSTNNSPSPCTITSTLSKVTELFLCSVNSLNANQSNENMQKVMENYDRVNMVMRVMKLAYPQISENKSRTMKSNVMVTPPLATIKAESNNTNKYRDHSPIASPQPTTTAPTTTTITTTPATTITSTTTTNQTTISKHPHISPKEFLDEFEKTCKAFAADNGFDFKNVWESLLVHALPKEKLEWAEKNILNRNLSWYETRQLYLKSFSQNSNVQQTSSRNRFEGRPSRVHNPLPTPPPTNDEEVKIARTRQEKYAEYFLALTMKEYESIGDYNRKFIRYVNIANIGMTQSDLMRRYLGSLLKNHRECMETLLTKTEKSKQPQNIEAMMKLTEKVVSSQQLVKDRLYAQCGQNPISNNKRQLTDEQQEQPPSKRYSSFCA